MRLPRLAAALAVLASVFVAVPAVAAPAVAATATPGGPGADVSWPQCVDKTAVVGPLPSGQSFGVVGINSGLGNATNPCLAAELAWARTSAGGTTQPGTSLYVMAQDPGLQASWWPDTDRIKDGSTAPIPAGYGHCLPDAGGTGGQVSIACAFVYGYDMAEEDLTSRGVADPAAYRWWIDVETTNSWDPPQDVNRADIEGMVAAFQGAGAWVGLYSTPYQWQLIVGTVTTAPLAGLPSWIAGTGGVGAAETGCYSPGLTTGSSVVLAQYRSGAFDADLACHRLSATPTPTVTGTAAVDQTLTAHPGTWGPAPVALRLQWYRGTTAIPGATGTTYRTTAADAGHPIRVTATGSRQGFTTITRSSRTIGIAVPVSRLTASHSLTAGRSLLAPNGRYRLTQQADGNLVLYKDTGKALWNSHRFGHGYVTTMQSDGNLVTYAPGHHAVWASRTNGKHATSAVMQSDGNFVLYTASGKAVWATRTYGR